MTYREELIAMVNDIVSSNNEKEIKKEKFNNVLSMIRDNFPKKMDYAQVKKDVKFIYEITSGSERVTDFDTIVKDIQDQDSFNVAILRYVFSSKVFEKSYVPVNEEWRPILKRYQRVILET